MTDKQTSAALLIVGDTGSGKTSLIGTLALFVWMKFQKITRLTTFDPGGYGDDVLALIRQGIIQVFRGYTRDPEGNLGLALETCSLVTRGYWPQLILDVETGLVEPGAKLVAPRVQVLLMHCPAGHPVLKARSAQQLKPTKCPTCKVLTSAQNTSGVTQTVEITPGFENVGAYCFDGLTSMSEWGMGDMGVRASKNELGGEKGALNILTSGGIKYGAGNRASVGFMQNRAHEWVMNSLAIPGQVVPPTFTALELRATDDRSDLPIFGPKIAGQAKTAEVPQWFGNTLGSVIWSGEKGPEWRLYLREYRTPGENAPHLCKVRTTPNVMPEFLCDVVDGKAQEPFSQFSLGKFYELVGASYSKAEERLRAKLGEVKGPGLGDGSVGGANPPLAAERPAGQVAPPPPQAPAQTSPAPAEQPSVTAAAPSPAAPPAVTTPAAAPSVKSAGAPSTVAPRGVPPPAAGRPPGVPPRPPGPVAPAAAPRPVPPPAVVAPQVAPTPSRVAPPPPAGASASRPNSVPPPAGARPAPRPAAPGPVLVGALKK